MKKRLLAFLLVLVLALSSVAVLAACGEEKVSIKYMNGETELKAVKIVKGTKAANLEDLTVEGKVFKGWFATPDLTHKFDFEQAIDKDITIFGGFAQYEADTRDFFMLGSGTSPNLKASNWGNGTNAKLTANHTATANVYTITTDLHEADEFVIGADAAFKAKHGAGYIVDMADNFTTGGSMGDASTRASNIVVAKDGNYTITLTTNPAEDFYGVDYPGYTEDSKEVHKYNNFDTIEIVRNGELEEAKETAILKIYIKGSKITEWKDAWNDMTELKLKSGEVYEGTYYLVEDEEFLFTSTQTVGEETSAGALYIKGADIATDSASLFTVQPNGNIIAKATGDYKFSYDKATGKLSVELLAGEGTPEVADYYLDGTFIAGQEWKDYAFVEEFKLSLNAESGLYEIKNVAMIAESEFIIQMFKPGSTERGEWGTDGYNGLGSRNFTYVQGAGDLATAVGGSNNNIKMAAEGVYNISYNPYSHIITIADAAADMVVGVKGTMNGWEPLTDGYGLTKQDDGKFAITLTLAVDAEFGLAVNPEGSNGWVGRDQLGTAGDAHDNFGTSGNLKATVAGSYKIVYDPVANTLDIYSVTE